MSWMRGRRRARPRRRTASHGGALMVAAAVQSLVPLLLAAASSSSATVALPAMQKQQPRMGGSRRTVVGCHECSWNTPGAYNVDGGFAHYNWSLLTQLNFHSAATLLPNGTMLQAGVDAGWNHAKIGRHATKNLKQCDLSDANSTSVFSQIRRRCAEHGVRLVMSIGTPAITAADMKAFLSDERATSLAVKQLTAAAVARRVGGLSLDWEGSYEFSLADMGSLVAFMTSLRMALRAQLPHATLSYAIDGMFSPSWVAKFPSVSALAAAVDQLFLMCYDSTGIWGQDYPTAQANSPLFGGSSDYGYDIAWQVNQSLAAGMPIDKVVVGTPWYGACSRLAVAPGFGAGEYTCVCVDQWSGVRGWPCDA
jgi:GH18 family chitinase